MTALLPEFVHTKNGQRAIAGTLLLLAILFPFAFDTLATQMDTAIFVLAYMMMALGLNIVVGFAGLLDLGYVAFYAIGAYSVGWLASDHFTGIGGDKGLHVLTSTFVTKIPGIHLNFFLVLIAAMIIAAALGALIGLPTLRLRGDYIAIVTLAFGEIIGRIALNGDEITFGKYHLTAGQQAISPVDQPFLPIANYEFDSAFNLRPYYWTGLALLCFTLFVNFRLRDSRLGRAWIALREDEVAAASMGVPLVRTKLLAYAAGAALGGVAGAFLGSYNNAINSNQFQFSFSIFVLAMVILGGMGSIWGVTAGAFALAVIDRYLIPDVFDDLPSQLFGLDFQLTQLSFGIFGFLLVLIMIMRPEGLFPERRRQIEFQEGIGSDEAVFEVKA
jgi:branched-chain amino acid transport system permease protein